MFVFPSSYPGENNPLHIYCRCHVVFHNGKQSQAGQCLATPTLNSRVCGAHAAWRHEGSGRTWRSESHHRRTYSCVVSPGCTLSTHGKRCIGYYSPCAQCACAVTGSEMRLTITRDNVNIHINMDELFECLWRIQRVEKLSVYGV